MDGVVLHQPNIHRFVATRINCFVRKQLEPIIEGISYYDAERINHMLYTTYGHTLLGLNSMFNLKISVNEFNTSVYDSTTTNYITNFQHDEEMNTRTKEIRQLLDICHVSKIPVYIFSNAPMCWSNTVIDTMGLTIEKENVLGSDHPLFDVNRQLKPVLGLYSDVTKLISYRHGNDPSILFVDDSIANIRPCMNMKGWKPILLCQNMPNLNLGSMYVRSSIPNMFELL